MNNLHSNYRAIILMVAAIFSAYLFSNQTKAATVEVLQRDAAQSLAALYKKNPIAEDVSKHARAILVFPNIVKAGLIFGGAYGEGVLTKDKKFDGYYNSVTASWGWQAGAE
jgi:lipid-binding SYLF domain-containing protein